MPFVTSSDALVTTSKNATRNVSNFGHEGAEKESHASCIALQPVLQHHSRKRRERP